MIKRMTDNAIVRKTRGQTMSYKTLMSNKNWATRTSQTWYTDDNDNAAPPHMGT